MMYFIDDQGLNQRLNLVSLSRSAIVAIHCKLPDVTAVLVNIQSIYHFLLCILQTFAYVTFVLAVICCRGDFQNL